MDRGIFSSAELSIPHDDLIQLILSGELEIGISLPNASLFTFSDTLCPKKTYARAVAMFWNYAALLAFIVGIYASFRYHWWSFVVGIAALIYIWRRNKRTIVDNIVKSALLDKEFYQRADHLGAWLFKLSPETAKKYR